MSASGIPLFGRLRFSGTHDSEQWAIANVKEFKPVPRICRTILAVGADDLRFLKPELLEVSTMNYDWVVKKATYKSTGNKAPPYLIYLDHEARDIVFAITGLSWATLKDIHIFLDDEKMMFDDGYVHNGFLKSAKWLISSESKTLKDLIEKNPSYTVTFAGHSLGSGVAALLTLLVASYCDESRNIARSQIRCYAISPARCMSLNLAVKHADIINSVVLQDDFLPRTATHMDDIFKCIFCLPCLLCDGSMEDIFLSEERKLTDPQSLYTPGRLYHIVNRKPFGCQRYLPVVKTAIPVEGVFEHTVFSANATSDHQLASIEREAQKALNLMMARGHYMKVPPKQRTERKETIAKEHDKEHKDALEGLAP